MNNFSEIKYSNPIRMYIGEVIAEPSTLTYKQNINNTKKNKIYEIRCNLISNDVTKNPCTAYPANINIQKIPLIGEYVLLFQAYSDDSRYTSKKPNWYYLSDISILTNLNNNSVPGISGESFENSSIGATFEEQSINSLQPYEGDILIQGRFGNNIRIGSTVTNSNTYDRQPTWTSNNNGDPIIILSTNKNRNNTSFSIEHVETDLASLYLTSTQHLNELKITKPLTIHNVFNGSQMVGIADRIILRAKTDIAVIDSQEGIVLNTPNNIYIGGEEANQPLVHGDVLLDILNKIIDHIEFVQIECGELIGGFKSKDSIKTAREKLSDLLSSKYRMEFNPRK
ncbi:MAG: hypothetical protein EBU12_01430 [Microbacteriaceae bacterium]|nr:hypothetical protein [Microbacteriaceae bacterium]